jgi:small-conductance mechanosensitive channel
VLAHQATHSAVFTLLAIALGGLLLGRGHLIRFIEARAEGLGKPTTDRFAYTVQVLVATLVAAGAWPLVTAVVGWQLQVSSRATDFSGAVGEALLTLAMQFYFLRALRLICMPRGLAAAHFRWPEPDLRLLRRELDRLSWTYLPAAGVLLVIVHLDPVNAGWAAGRAAFVILVTALSFSLFCLLHPKNGLLAHATRQPGRPTRALLYPFWYPFLVVAPLALVLLLATLGVQSSQLQWLVAALGVGIGFGLQEIVANFVSGLIILFERPVRVGDIVSVGGTDGVVTRIRIRATTIRNWDRQELLVPNKDLVTGRVLNWSLSDKMTRVVVVAGVAYESDVDAALELMREAAEEHPKVLDDPAPVLSFEGFGDNALTLILRAYLASIDDRVATITDLHKAINRKFAAAGIVIAFPQRDLHLDASRPLQVELRQPEGELAGR